MRLGDKPLAEMSHEEMLEAITILQSEREALRAEAIKRKREAETGKMVPKEPRKVKEKVVDQTMTDMLAFLKGANDAPK